MNEITLTPGKAGRLMVSDLLPVILESNDKLHEDFGTRLLAQNHDNPDHIKRYVRDFRTIRLSLGQRMGHSYAATVMAQPGDLVVCHHANSALYLASSTKAGVEFMSRSMLMEALTYSVKAQRYYRTIWLMDFNIWPRTSLSQLREKLITSPDQRIIILG